MENAITASLIPLAAIDEAHARIRQVVLETPCLRNHDLSERYGCDLFLKREDMQSVRSFKIRGAYNKIKGLSETEAVNGVVCASAGNHAQGVAFACAKLGIRGTIYMPDPTPSQKVTKVRAFGGDWVKVILSGDTFDDAYAAALEHSAREAASFVHPFDDKEVIAGQGTIAKEMLEQLDRPLDVLLVAVGGGGLLSGVGSYFRQLSPGTKIIAVEAAGAAALAASMEAGKRVRLDKIDAFADGIAVKEIGLKTFPIIQEVIDDHLIVPEGAICSAILQLYNEQAIVAEPAGAAAIAALEQLAGVIRGKRVGVILCGGNNDVHRTQEITERAMLHEGRKHFFIVRFPQRSGALRDFLHVLGPEDDITHFEYTKKTNRASGPALVGLELKNPDDFKPLLARMRAEGINFEHINDNPMLFEMLV
ncbi:threonine dehydratase [Lewinellaceae bacterium SD302]|nr:threonine dehydratase [Lewinellaceae bacterium SD302]